MSADVIPAFLRLAESMFPDVLEPDPQPHGDIGPVRVIATHMAAPVNREFIEAARESSLLALGDEALRLHSSTGTAWSPGLEMLGPRMALHAARTVIAEGGDGRELDEYLNVARRTMEDLIALIEGEERTVLVMTGYSGLTVEEPVETVFGLLRNASPIERGVRPFAIAPTAILQREVKVKYALSPADDNAIPFPGGYDLRGHAEVLHQSPDFSLAVLLAAFNDERGPVAVPAWSTTLLPAYGGGNYWLAGFGRPSMMGVPDRTLGRDECKEVALWCELVQEHQHEAIQIATQRIVSAAQERVSHQDELIDSVMAWENLFGAGAPAEVGFRVTGAMSHLLEPDPEKRQAVRANLGKIYGLRSKIVHGSSPPPAEELKRRATEALVTALDCLRILFKRFPQLIPEQERGTKILIEGWLQGAEARSNG